MGKPWCLALYLVMASFGYSFSSVHVRACVHMWVHPWVCTFSSACLCVSRRRDVRIALGFLSVCFPGADAQRYNLASRASFWAPRTPPYNEEITSLGCIFFSVVVQRRMVTKDQNELVPKNKSRSYNYFYSNFPRVGIINWGSASPSHIILFME